ncbi:ATP-dependent helicase, partial [Paenibacillus pinistramenti]|uniref:ATP-dependent helicase n=1 Tax=Paenibacillus pinistramenti TaxID=1768003 RepID=UPI001107FFA2
MEPYLFQHRPDGAEGQAPPAPRAAAETSRELVKDAEPDAWYFRRLEDSGILLNRAQIRAVRHGGGPALTLAGAGSGKTSVLICRTGYLIGVRGAAPASILLLTFSSKAAAEMRERIAGLPGLSDHHVKALTARTFHAFFLRFLYSRGAASTLLADTTRQHIMLKQIMRGLNLPQDAYEPETLLALLSAAKMNLTKVEDLPENSETERELKRIFQRYEAVKAEQQLMDFDDVLVRSYDMLRDDPRSLRWLRERFRYIMVDEFQDTNLLQYELVRLIAAPANNLMAVGDDDQTIYSFNGARSEFILKFDKQYPGAVVITLDINYRSCPAIVGLGNGIIRHNVERRPKTLKAARLTSTVKPLYLRPYTTDKEAEFLLNRIEHEVTAGSRSYGDYAILYRAASNNRAILEQLVMRGIPHIDYGDGQLLYQQRVVLPVLAYLRLSLNRRDFQAIESILPTLYINRNLGMAHIMEQEKQRAKKGPMVHLRTLPGLKDFQIEKVNDRIELIRSLRSLTPVEAIRQIRSRFYNSYLETDERQEATQHREMLKELLDELETSAERFTGIPEFLDFVDEVVAKNEEGRTRRLEDQGNRVALMTIHRSKGLEFPVVYLIGASEGSLPHASALDADRMKDIHPGLSAELKGEAALEEERRLAYVAVTRAREELIVSSPARYRGKKADVSRFLLAAFGAAGAAAGTAGAR